jgi:aminopeptidase N
MRSNEGCTGSGAAHGTLGMLLGVMGIVGMGAAGCGPGEPGTTEADGLRASAHPFVGVESLTGPQGDFSASITRYEYEFNTQTGAAFSQLYLNVDFPGGNCFLVNAPLGLTNVEWNDQPPLSVETLPGAVRVCGQQGQMAGQVKLEAKLTVPLQTYDFTQVGFSRRQDRGGNTFSYLLNWVGSCDLFGPCDDRTELLTSYVLTVKHAQGEVVVCPGTRTIPNTTTTKCELTGLMKAPTYSSFAVASNRGWSKRTFAEVANKFKLVFFEIAGGRLASSLDATSVTAYMNWIIGQLGPLPYGTELRVAGGPTDWLGAEHPANLILREDLPDLRRDYANMTMHTLMHEVAHQWAGNRTTLSAPSDFIWKEAIAEYLTYLFELQSRPAGEAEQTRAYWDRLARTAAYYPQPGDDPPPVFLSQAADVYGTGPMILFLQLEPLLGQQTVINGIKHFLSLPGHRGVAELRDSLEFVSNQNLGPYFAAWVHGSGDPDWPFFEVTPEQVDGQVTLTAKQLSYSGTRYPVSVDVLLEGATQKQKVTLNYGLAPTSDTLTVTVPFSEPLVQVTVDPENRVVNRRFFGLTNGIVEEPSPPRWVF